MSRSQETTAFNTSSGQNAGYYSNAQNSYANANADIGDYEDQLSKYAASNPYGQGGQYQTTQNQILSNTSDAMAKSAGEALQSQALRTGGNTAGGVAATEQMEEQNNRDLSSNEAQANAQRIDKGAQYGQSVLNATEVPAQLEAGLASGQANAGNAALGEETKAGETPSWMDELGQGLIQGYQGAAAAAAKAAGSGG